MLCVRYEHTYHSICGDGSRLNPVHGGHIGRRRELQVVSAETNRRQQFEPEIRELARRDRFHRRDFDLYDLDASLAAMCRDDLLKYEFVLTTYDMVRGTMRRYHYDDEIVEKGADVNAKNKVEDEARDDAHARVRAAALA